MHHGVPFWLHVIMYAHLTLHTVVLWYMFAIVRLAAKNCVDHSACADYENYKEFYCRYHKWMQMNCKIFCGLCPKSPCKEMDHARCNLFERRKQQYCRNDWTKHNCGMMCGLCDTPECTRADNVHCSNYARKPTYYCKHDWIRQNCKSMCGYCLSKGPNWPKGEYGILSREKCPPSWYEFNHCIDTENDNNKDITNNFRFNLGSLCDKSSVTFRYCFKGPKVPTRNGGFWTMKTESVYVVRNKIGLCSSFGKDGGTVLTTNEEKNNKNLFGNDDLNGVTFHEYRPYNFLYFHPVTQLSFCEVGLRNRTKRSKDYIEVGRFNRQEFGFFVHPSKPCPIVNSPYGFLEGVKESVLMDDSNKGDNVFTNNPPILDIGMGSVWSVCAYDPKLAMNSTQIKVR